MKKVLLLTAAIVVLASCSQNESELLKNPANEIRFSNLNDRVTRAANDAGDDYKVYAKSTLSGETTWFINDAIDGTANTTLSTNKYYWPTGSTTVSFFAYAPATSGTATATYATPAVSVNYTVPANADEDFTVATPKTAQNQTMGSPAGTVNFVFEHMLSKVTVKAVLSADLLTSGYVLDLTAAKADLVVASNQGTVDAAVATPAFGSLSGGATYTTDTTYMIMPQTSTGTTIQLKNVKITKNSAEVFNGNLKLYPIVAGDITVPSANQFAKGYHYTLTLEIIDSSHDGSDQPIFGDEIKFTATTTNWIPSGISLNQP